MKHGSHNFCNNAKYLVEKKKQGSPFLIEVCSAVIGDLVFDFFPALHRPVWVCLPVQHLQCGLVH